MAWFLGIAFSGAWILFLLPLAIGPAGSPAYRVAVLVTFPVAMWMPGIAAILATVVIGGQRFGSLNLRRLGPKRFYLWAWLLPPVLALATGLLTVVLGAGQLDLSFGLIREALMAAPGFEDISLLLIVALQIGLAISIAPFINTIFALGEELGWRGFLLNRLLPLGRWSAILASGVIWGLWHAPAILQGLNYPSRPVLGVGMMVVFTVLLSCILSWLYLQTRSPWAPALGHGAINATAGAPLLFLFRGRYRHRRNDRQRGGLDCTRSMRDLAGRDRPVIVRFRLSIRRRADDSRRRWVTRGAAG